jgi:hypothetical protein
MGIKRGSATNLPTNCANGFDEQRREPKQKPQRQSNAGVLDQIFVERKRSLAVFYVEQVALNRHAKVSKIQLVLLKCGEATPDGGVCQIKLRNGSVSDLSIHGARGGKPVRRLIPPLAP